VPADGAHRVAQRGRRQFTRDQPLRDFSRQGSRVTTLALEDRHRGRRRGLDQRADRVRPHQRVIDRRDRILPRVLNRDVVRTVASAVREAAVRSG
jgi:hypothetical protein